MDTQEFKKFCSDLFLRYGFTKVKNMYYLKCKDLLCGVYLQRSIAEAYYVNVNFYIGEYTDKNFYPTHTSDIYRRLAVPSKCKDSNGKYFMNACIEFELYTKEEIEPYFVDTIEKYVVPLITEGKKYILENQEFYLKAVFKHDMNTVLAKLNAL